MFSHYLFYRYIDEGKDESLRDGKDKMLEIERRASRLEGEREEVTTNVDKIRKDLAAQQVRLQSFLSTYYCLSP